MTSFDFSVMATEFALNWFVQSTLLILFGLIAAHLLKKRGSAIQSAIYRTTLVAVFICPLATWCLSQAGVSGWSVRLPGEWQRELKFEQPVISNETNIVASESLEAPIESLANTESFDESYIEDLEQSFNGFAKTKELLEESPQQAKVAEIISAKAGPMPEPSTDRKAVNPVVALLFAIVGFWLIGALVLLTRLVTAWKRMAKLRDRALKADESTIRTCQELASTMQVRQPQVMQSPYLPSPCLTGLLRPTVLLPEGDKDLSIREVLIHELAHLRRRDCHWNLLRQIATSLFFFQPLLWYLSHQIESSAEEVCDDYVVQLGGDRCQYAHRLADIA